MNSGIALIDIGGSAVKVSIYIQALDALVWATEETLPVTRGESVIQATEVLLQAVFKAMNRASGQLEKEVKVERLYVSTIRQGYCLIGRNEVLTPVYYNSDTSGSFAFEALSGYGLERLYEETGHWYAPQLTLPKLIHLNRIKPELFTSGTKLAFVHDWLVWELTGRLITEMTLVSAGQLALIQERHPHVALLEYFHLNSELIPPIADFFSAIAEVKVDVLNHLDSRWQNCVVHVGGGDSHFLHAGASLLKSGTVVVSAGSSTPVSFLKSDLSNSNLSRAWKSTSFNHSLFLHEGNVGYPGSYYGWLEKQSGLTETEAPLTVDQIEGAPSVFGSCQHWTREAWNACPPFSIMNLNPDSSLAQIKLGLTLDYAFALKQQILDIGGGDSSAVEKIVVTGGGANELLARILQTILGQRVETLSSQRCLINAFNLIEGGVGKQVFNNAIVPLESFSNQLSNALLEKEMKHAIDYQSIEGCGELITNVR
jgi:sugar (pentulose or hexulose) kinase